MLLALCVCFFTVGVGISISLKKCNQTLRNNIITVYSGSVGGFLALLGVFLTIIAGKGTEMEKRKLSHIPEFFLPNKYDLAKATNYKIGSNDTQSIIIPNWMVCVQNTDKTEFFIEEVVVYSGENKSLITDSFVHYINKEALFCLSFYCEEKAHKIILKTKSIDDYFYSFEIDLDKQIITKKI